MLIAITAITAFVLLLAACYLFTYIKSLACD